MKMIKWEYSKKLNDKGAIDKFEKKYSIEFPSYLKKIMSENNLFNINVGTLIGIFINNQIDNNAVIRVNGTYIATFTVANVVFLICLMVLYQIIKLL